ncbi:hypothetical protein Pla110_07270 [Polystyrenella longa]|uniref:Uncharacterized protein n=1 Tax=Polystyrenella longa TaxID=2528007 RepID=A0A518CIF4_9PLAN|nr:hypothetical protein [Polystyrenella longa]QDU79023.1 hypothetical protein Pla110_07270 [Polystyrenella longa]
MKNSQTNPNAKSKLLVGVAILLFPFCVLLFFFGKAWLTAPLPKNMVFTTQGTHYTPGSNWLLWVRVEEAGDDLVMTVARGQNRPWWHLTGEWEDGMSSGLSRVTKTTGWILRVNEGKRTVSLETADEILWFAHSDKETISWTQSKNGH